MPTLKTTTKFSPKTEPIRVKFTQAMEMLSLSRPTLARLILRGVFTPQYPNGSRGRGKRIYLLYAEVKVYGEQGEEAVRAMRDAKAAGRGRAKRA